MYFSEHVFVHQVLGHQQVNGKGAGTGHARGPFEHLGHALCRLHTQIEHIPTPE
jgi:hypothetical protein